jgi:hypothetical protein
MAWEDIAQQESEKRDRQRLQAGPKQHTKELQMKRTEEEEATATTKLVRETGRPRQDGDIQWCVGIAAFNFSLATHLFLIYFTSLI